MKSVSIHQITEVGANTLRLCQSSAQATVTEVLPVQTAKHTSLVFISSLELLQMSLQNPPAALVITEDVFQQKTEALPSSLTVWTTSSIQQAMSSILPLFDLPSEYARNRIHPTAIIHPTAEVSAGAHIGAYSVIDAFAKVGADTVVFPHVYIGPFCEVGARCHISPHVSIGSDGFGFFTDKNFKHHKIPQIGKVVIEDDCEFGSHCAVDRATLTETRIKKGSKFDNFCHIAHNVVIGENAIAAAGFMVSGSTIIGKNLMAAGAVHVAGHLKISDNVILSGRAGVSGNVEAPGMYGGFPLESHKESIRTLASLPQVKNMRKQLKKILNHLNLKED